MNSPTGWVGPCMYSEGRALAVTAVVIVCKIKLIKSIPDEREFAGPNKV